MKKLRFAIIGGNPGVHAADLCNEIIRRGHEVETIRMKELVLSFSNGISSFSYKGRDILHNDIYLFRGGYRTVKPAVVTLAHHLIENGKVVINKDLGESGFFGDKVFQASVFAQQNIPHPKTVQPLSTRQLPAALKSTGFPVIAKPMFGSKGFGIMKFDSVKPALQFLRKHNRTYFLQEYVPITGDIRVFVVGDRAIAAMERRIVEGDFRSNASLGAKTAPAAITAPLQKLALAAARAMNYDIAGVDIIQNKNGYLVLEVNSAPQWKALKQTTGIDPSVAIVDYALQQYSLARNS